MSLGTADLFAKFSLKTGDADLKGVFHVGQNSVELKSLMVIRHPATDELLGYFIIVNDAGVISQGIDAATLQALGIIA